MRWKFFWALTVVAGDAEDDDSGLLELLEGVAEAAGLDGTAGGVGAGVEEENDGFIGEIGEIDGLAVLVLEGEVFDFIVDLHAILWRILMDSSWFSVWLMWL